MVDRSHVKYSQSAGRPPLLGWRSKARPTSKYLRTDTKCWKVKHMKDTFIYDALIRVPNRLRRKKMKVNNLLVIFRWRWRTPPFSWRNFRFETSVTKKRKLMLKSPLMFGNATKGACLHSLHRILLRSGVHGSCSVFFFGGGREGEGVLKNMHWVDNLTEIFLCLCHVY